MSTSDVWIFVATFAAGTAIIAAISWSERRYMKARKDERRAQANTIFGERNCRIVDVPPGWKMDATRWEWRELSRDEDELTVTQGLYVYTRNEATGKEKWRPVDPGTRAYGSEGASVYAWPTGKYETRVVPLHPEVQP